jgi:hypothetical protein
MTGPACHACGRSDGTHDPAEHVAYRASGGVTCSYCGRWADGEAVLFPRIEKQEGSKLVLHDDVWHFEEAYVLEQGSAGICRRCHEAKMRMDELTPSEREELRKWEEARRTCVYCKGPVSEAEIVEATIKPTPRTVCSACRANV